MTLYEYHSFGVCALDFSGNAGWEVGSLRVGDWVELDCEARGDSAGLEELLVCGIEGHRVWVERGPDLRPSRRCPFMAEIWESMKS